MVSTHSRPKAAAPHIKQNMNNGAFQHTAARRRLLVFCDSCCHIERVSTHSRPKAAARIARFYISIYSVSTHSRPKAAALPYLPYILTASFNTQPPEGGCCKLMTISIISALFQHTAARRRLLQIALVVLVIVMFQHTAARRRLPLDSSIPPVLSRVSTHSRPKAAAVAVMIFYFLNICFNTQPPEGGCGRQVTIADSLVVSTHSRPKAAAPYLKKQEKSAN